MSAVVQVAFDFLAEAEEQPAKATAPRRRPVVVAERPAPGPTPAQAIQQVVSLFLQLLPGFACVNADECGNVAPVWNPVRAANLAERGIGVRLLCTTCIGGDVAVPIEGWTPPLLMRRAGGPSPDRWSPDGELIQASAWEEVQAWSGELQGEEWRRRRRRQLAQPSRALLTAAGRQVWRP